MSHTVSVTRVLVAAVLAIFAAASLAATPPAFEARYALSRGGFDVGQVHIAVSAPTADTYRYESRVTTSGVASVFADRSLTQVSKGRWTDHGPEPRTYWRLDRRGSERARSRLRFADEVALTRNGEARVLEVPPSAHDPASLTLKLIHDARREALAGRYGLVDETGTYRDYRVVDRGEARVEALDRTFRARHIDRTALDGRFALQLYVAPELDGIPVRMVWEDRDSTYTMVLEALQR